MPDVVFAAEPYAEVGDVEDRWRPLSQEEAERASALLGDASVMLDAAYPALARLVRIAGVPAAATMVVAGMVRRALVAPAEGYAVDAPAAYTPTSYANIGGNLYLTKSERQVMAAVTGSRRGRAFSISLGSEE